MLRRTVNECVVDVVTVKVLDADTSFVLDDVTDAGYENDGLSEGDAVRCCDFERDDECVSDGESDREGVKDGFLLTVTVRELDTVNVTLVDRLSDMDWEMDTLIVFVTIFDSDTEPLEDTEGCCVGLSVFV